ncbi:MAG: bacterioferritin, partial [Rhodospirillales bacterium]|nr:bacterioferritin [Rhodospirillales bacterium]
RIGEDVPEILRAGLELEQAERKDFIEAIALCERDADYVSRNILRHLLGETEEHLDWYETQLELIGKMGLPNYLQSSMGEIEE